MGDMSENERNMLKEGKQKDVLKKLSKLEKKPIAVHSFSGYFQPLKPTFLRPARGKIPASLRLLCFESVAYGEELHEKCFPIFQLMKLSKQNVDYI